jgi:hypothetical protein
MRIGTVTRPNEIEPDQIARATVPLSPETGGAQTCQFARPSEANNRAI